MTTTFLSPPVHGYRRLDDEQIALVNEHKQMEERLLRHMEAIGAFDTSPLKVAPDGRWMAIARTHFEQGFMALNRAVFKPERIKLPEDE